ncbi:MAG: hypothetical protein UW82_C0004G0069 [candidate division WWE3 bacterium GW2011_GWC2_44_9]|uniref:Uncharacterized protein n=1 Tax=candidate division WWE3 bacterium GW2011_GWC2_44_9 TaxID=1619125 RepID=A0A0G1KNF5_UNCKA|nr:MAG: hypothetical protein UW82_C0004G0069 [candidate division WWE3 bacterium GW2011_GWC2_44_9]OGW69249.1 MAG: hypothetical protein A2036_03895 [Omnitrophica bacterium GWA2_50_21]
MNKTHAAKREKKIRGTAYELISIMTIVSCTAIERCFSPHAKERSTILDIYKDKNFQREMKDALAHDKDLSILAKNFSTFIRVAEKVARGQGHDIGN